MKIIDAKYEIEYIIDWIRDYFIDNGTTDTKAVIGISGGKDSTISAALLCRALGPERVIAVLMPNGEQSDIEDSYEICRELNIPTNNIYNINIEKIVKTCFGATLEINENILTNTPSRVRMIMLYQIAALVGGRVCNTGNASEKYVGYTTKYGDLAGDFAILRNYYVRDVIALGMGLEEIPMHLITKTPGDGMSGYTDEERFGFTYKQLDSYVLDNINPGYEITREIKRRHKLNMHKNVISFPAPMPCSRHDDNEMFDPRKRDVF